MRSRAASLTGAVLMSVAVSLVPGAAASASSARAASHGGGHAALFTINAGPLAVNGGTAALQYGFYEGIFKRNGINMKISYASGGGASAIVTLQNNTFQMSIAAPTALITDYEQGIRVECVAGFLQSLPISLIVNASSGITSPTQLAGHTIGVTAGSATVGFIPAYLAHYGLSESQVTIEQLSSAALVAEQATGQVAGQFASAYATVPPLKKLGIKTLTFPMSAVPGFTEENICWAVSDSFAAAHPRVVKDLVRAIQESELGAEAHPLTAARDLVLSSPATAPPINVTEQEFIESTVNYTTKNDKGHAIGWMSPKDWAQTQSFGQRFLSLVPLNPLSLVYTNKYIDDSLPLSAAG